MARHKNINWSLPDGVPNGRGSRTHSFDAIHTSLLMDIRDELQTLNRLLGCANFTNIPWTLKRIAENTTKPKRAASRKASRRSSRPHTGKA